MTPMMNRRGFTLVEMLVVIALLALVGGLAISFFLSTIGVRAKAQHRLEVQENARLVLARVEYEIRRARGVEATTDFDVNLATTGGATLDLDMSAAGNDPTTFDVVDLSGIEPESLQCECSILPFNYRPKLNN